MGNNTQETLIAEYTYNRFGERIKKVVYSNTKQPKITYYLYDGHQLTAEVDESGQVTAQYLYQNHRPILKLEGKTAYAIHTDHLGAPRLVTDEDQKTVWSADYSPFGLIDIGTQQITLNLRLPGQYEDQESGTYYNYHRDYDPNTGRYLTSDPIGIKGGLNTYAYVSGNPLNAIDPLGLFQATPGTPLYEALVRAGAIAASDGPQPYYGDVAAIAYLGGFALGMGIGLALDIDPVYGNALEQSDFDFIVSEIQLYKPGYTYDTPTPRAPNWEDYFGLLDELYETQLGYVETIRDSVCSPEYAPHSEELLAQAQRGIHFRGSIDAIIYQNDDLIDQQLQLAYEDYRAEGGGLTFEDWVAQGMPEANDLCSGFNSVESNILNEAQNILSSTEMVQIRNAHAAGEPLTVNISGRLIQYEPGLPASGMTMFGENGFLIGREAFALPGELGKTVLHELHRLNTSTSSTGVSGDLASEETQAAFDFAERASRCLGNIE